MYSLKRSFTAAILLALCMTCYAGNPPNPCGNHGNNCDPGNPSGGSADASASATAIGLGVGYANANAQGGDGGNANVVGSGNSSNLNVLGQQQSNTNKLSNFGNSASVSGASVGDTTATGGNATGGAATANNHGNTVTGGATNVQVGVQGDTYVAPDDVTVRSAPSLMAASAYPTAPCVVGKSFGISGLFNTLPLSMTYGGGSTDISCQHLEIARAVTETIGKDAGTKILCLSELVQLALPGQCAGSPTAIRMSSKQRKMLKP